MNAHLFLVPRRWDKMTKPRVLDIRVYIAAIAINAHHFLVPRRWDKMTKPRVPDIHIAAINTFLFLPPRR